MTACLTTGCFEGQMFQTILTQINGRKNFRRRLLSSRYSLWGSSELGGYTWEISLHPCAAFSRHPSCCGGLEGALTWPWTCAGAGESPCSIPGKHLSSSSFLPSESLVPVDGYKAKPIKGVFSVLFKSSHQDRRRQLIPPLCFLIQKNKFLIIN